MSMVTKSRPSAPKRVYQLLIELNEVEPRVWRRLWVPDTLTMAKLDRVIQAAMG
jgi:Plasmid pRiA4b ORF-3-like protein